MPAFIRARCAAARLNQRTKPFLHGAGGIPVPTQAAVDALPKHSGKTILRGLTMVRTSAGTHGFDRFVEVSVAIRFGRRERDYSASTIHFDVRRDIREDEAPVELCVGGPVRRPRGVRWRHGRSRSRFWSSLWRATAIFGSGRSWRRRAFSSRTRTGSRKALR